MLRSLVGRVKKDFIEWRSDLIEARDSRLGASGTVGMLWAGILDGHWWFCCGIGWIVDEIVYRQVLICGSSNR